MSAFGDAGAVPPDVNHTLMIAGDLGASLVGAAAGYESVADMLIAELTAMGLTTSTTAMVGWQGPAGEMMQMSAAEFMEVCAAASAWIRIGQIQAAEVAAAHTAAVEQMIPAPVVWTNRTTQVGLVATNAFGQNTPAINVLDAQYVDFWVTNATSRTQYGAVVTTALGALSAPFPLSPTASNPLGPALGVAQDVGQTGGQSAFQAASKTMTTAADGQSQPTSIMSSMAGQAGGLFGQVGSAFGQVTSAGQQLPSMLGQAPQLFSGMLGPLSSMNGLNGAAAGGLGPEAAAAGASMGGMGAAGGGGGGLLTGSSALSTSFVRPASSFSTPTAPTLPGGWPGSSATAGESSPRPAGAGGGGLYGAPGPMSRETASGEQQRPGRTMQVTERPGSSRGERQRA